MTGRQQSASRQPAFTFLLATLSVLIQSCGSRPSHDVVYNRQPASERASERTAARTGRSDHPRRRRRYARAAPPLIYSTGPAGPAGPNVNTAPPLRSETGSRSSSLLLHYRAGHGRISSQGGHVLRRRRFIVPAADAPPRRWSRLAKLLHDEPACYSRVGDSLGI